MRTIKDKTARALLPVFVATAGVVATAFVLTVVVRLAQSTPHVGDIVAFVPSPAAPVDDGARLLVHRQDQFGCVLDLNVLRRSGGSLVVETQFSAETGTFRVHWAGLRTSNDAANCGSDADLVVNRLELNVLLFSAGGSGVDIEHRPIAATEVSY